MVRRGRSASGIVRLARGLVVLSLALVAIGLESPASFAVGGFDFTDWTATGGTAATGTLLDSPVTLSGWQLSPLPASYLNGTLPIWSAPYFTPPLPAADAVEFRAEAGTPHTYTLSLGAARTNPLLDLASLGTTLEFPAGTSITRLSGDDGFAVSGSTVIGAGDASVDPYGLNDSNGSASTARSHRSRLPRPRRMPSTVSTSKPALRCRRRARRSCFVPRVDRSPAATTVG